MLDERLLRATIDLDGDIHVYERLAISAIGSKHTSAIQNSAEIRIANIEKSVRDQLLTEGTPYSQLSPPLNSITIEAGRISTGLSQVFIGDITTVNITQVPDIWLTIRAITGQHRKGQVKAVTQAASASFSTIASQVAGELGLSLDFEADDKQVSNFSFSGAVEKMVGSLSVISNGVDAYIDDDRLVVRPRRTIDRTALTPVNINTGLIGIPEFIDVGVRCTVLMNPAIRLGADIELTSETLPTTNGAYNVYKIGFNLANRGTPFYYILECARKERII